VSLDPRYSNIPVLEHDGSWSVHVTDYQTGRSVKSMLFPTPAAARAEGRRILASWRYATGAVMGREGRA
jgi:hypothetical protein